MSGSGGMSRPPAEEKADRTHDRTHGRPPMTAPIPNAPHLSLAIRLSREMMEAERQDFRTSTVWLTREETDLICAALHAASGIDGARLDFLDRCVAAMAARDGTDRVWNMSIDREGLTLGAASGSSRSLSSSDGQPSCRAAIDEKMAELECARASTSDDDPRHDPRRDRTTRTEDTRASSKAP